MQSEIAELEDPAATRRALSSNGLFASSQGLPRYLHPLDLVTIYVISTENQDEENEEENEEEEDEAGQAGNQKSDEVKQDNAKVGENKHENDEEGCKFILHKDFATHYCPIFKAAFNSSFIEGQTQTYKLDSTSPDAVRLLIHWFYTQTLDIQQLVEEVDEDTKNMENRSLAELWVLADRLLIPRLQNAVIYKMHEVCLYVKGVPCRKTARYIYQNTSEESQLRRFLVHQCAIYVCPNALAKLSQDIPKQLFVDTLCLVRSKVNIYPIDLGEFLTSDA